MRERKHIIRAITERLTLHTVRVFSLSTISDIVLYVDAARDESVSGLGYVCEGSVSLSGERTLEGSYTSMEAEFHALSEGLRVAAIHSDGRPSCTVYCDCKPLIKKMCDDEVCRKAWKDYYATAHWLLDKFDSWEIEYCPRQNNGDAHDLARSALRDGRDR